MAMASKIRHGPIMPPARQQSDEFCPVSHAAAATDSGTQPQNGSVPAKGFHPGGDRAAGIAGGLSGSGRRRFEDSPLHGRPETRSPPDTLSYSLYPSYPPYCSTPEEMATRSVPPLADVDVESRLVHVTGAFRAIVAFLSSRDLFHRRLDIPLS